MQNFLMRIFVNLAENKTFELIPCLKQTQLDAHILIIT